MGQSLIIAARTFEVFNEEHMVEDLTLLAGKAAGVCYMPDDYMEQGIQDESKARKRAENTAKSGHHSVFDHGHITFMIHTNKMMAMILNSINVYNTSEKSARYTVMHPDSPQEGLLYTKWSDVLSEQIKLYYPTIPDKEVRKLALENARYMLSVFTPTILEYTLSFRQVYLLRDALVKLSQLCAPLTDSFHQRLSLDVMELASLLQDHFPDIGIHDLKNQHLRFIEYPFMPECITAKREITGDSYTLVYQASFAALAQMERHRSIRYSMYFTGDSNQMGYYVPPIVAARNLTAEWLQDIASVAECIPQGALVRITEQGIFEDFALKCKERLCGRTQLETVQCTVASLNKFLQHEDQLWEGNRQLLNSMTSVTASEDTNFPTGYKAPCARCKFTDFTCNEGCRWGSKEALTRLI
jgi:thymidylate synthase ThyX